jgi:uncharacterized surface anchored protein
LGTVTYQVTAGTLPPGLSLSTSGVLSGTPTAVGTYGPVTITATAPWGSVGQATTFAVNASITGTVTSQIGSKPAAGIRVQVFDANGLILATVYTGADGVYRVGALASGNYRLSFFDPAGGYTTQYWNGAATLAAATPLAVTAGATSNGDIALQPLTVIAGTVTDRDTAAPLANVRVGLYDSTGKAIQIAMTGTDGTYRFPYLVPGAYRLSFTDTTGNGHAIEYWSRATTLAAATAINATGGTATANEALEPLTTITGKVTDSATGAALSGIWVKLYDSAGNTLLAATTAADGSYTFSYLHDATYRLGFIDTSSVHPVKYWSASTTLAGATGIVAVGGYPIRSASIGL